MRHWHCTGLGSRHGSGTLSGPGEAHPAWCTGDHSLEGGHSSQAVTVEPDGMGYARALLYLWQPPGSPVMVAAELSADGDEAAMLYLFSLAGAEELRRVVHGLGQLAEEAGDGADAHAGS